uniref:pentapeptide repeat-containing protein n=1 Tax=Parvibacter caecicola TaxID=747645 RepID=UPI003C6DBB54
MSEPMDKHQIETMLDLHRKWLYDEPGGERANLRGANLRGANLRGANLEGANLEGANL